MFGRILRFRVTILRFGAVIQLVECLPYMPEAPCVIYSTMETRRRRQEDQMRSTSATF